MDKKKTIGRVLFELGYFLMFGWATWLLAMVLRITFAVVGTFLKKLRLSRSTKRA